MSPDGDAAYRFIQDHLIYLTPAEINHLVELCFSERLQPALRSVTADDLNIKPFWSGRIRSRRTHIPDFSGPLYSLA